jgi:hypothetical protein
MEQRGCLAREGPMAANVSMTARTSRLALLVVACLLGWPASGRAGLVKPGDPVAGHSGLTYFDLMRMVVTDLTPASAGDDAEAHRIVNYRHIEGKNSKTVPAGAVAIKYLEPLEIHTGGMSRLVLMADLGPSDEAVAEFVLLALFDIGGTPKLLDVVEVGTDRLTGFADKPLLALGRGSDLIRIDSDHFNSDEDFVNTELIVVRGDRFQLVDAVYTYNVKSCTYQLTEWPEVRTVSDRGRRYRAIVLTVPEKVELQRDFADCGDEKAPRPFVRTFHATYRWNARRRAFVAVSGNLAKLAKENATLNSADPPLPTRSGH